MALSPCRSQTAWLDGLRGLAALTVMSHHYLTAFSRMPFLGFDLVKNRNPLQLPFLRLTFDGFCPVAIFFVVSGYVCSMRALQLMHNNNGHDLVLISISRSMFRRGLRLFLPTLFVSLATAIAVHFGAFEPLRGLMLEGELKQLYFPGLYGQEQLQRFDTISDQLLFWVEEMWSLVNIWNVKPLYLHHSAHLWTIPYGKFTPPRWISICFHRLTALLEFRGSMYLYLTLIGIALFKPRLRLIALITMGVVNFLWQRWEGPLFFGGAAIALNNIMNGQLQQKTIPQTSNLKVEEVRRDHDFAITHGKSTTPRATTRTLAYIFALYFMSYPQETRATAAIGYGWILSCTPGWYNRKDKFSKSIGVLVFIYLLSTSEYNRNDRSNRFHIHRLLLSPFAQFMSRIMFAFYLLHGPLLFCFGYGTPHVIWYYIGRSSALNYGVGLVVGHLINFLVVIWIADIFTREVDVRIFRLIRWLEGVFFDSTIK